MLEINRISVLIDKSYFRTQQDGIFLTEGILPVLMSSYKLELVDLNWELQSENEWPAQFRILLAGELQDTDWHLLNKLEILVKCSDQNEILKWGHGLPFDLRLGEKSEFYIDENEVGLTSTVNRILSKINSIDNSRVATEINSQLERLSMKYFGSVLLKDLLTDLYYQIGGVFENFSGTMEISASFDKDHFSKSNEAPPYLFLNMPTVDLEYFVSHFNWPEISIKNYGLKLEALEVIGDNYMRVKVKELTKDWNIEISLKLQFRNNTLYPVVEDLQFDGLDFLTKTLFRLFKNVLINQIENRPISIPDVYAGFKSTFNSKYPFLNLQSGYVPNLEVLKLTSDQTEVLFQFIPDEELS